MQLKILSIGDEYTLSAQRYLAKTARCDDINVVSGVLYLADFTEEKHLRAIANDEPCYTFEYNNAGSIRTDVIENFSFSKAVDWFDWDYIVIQQSNDCADDNEGCCSFVCAVAEHIRQEYPDVRIAICEPWAFESDCSNSIFEKYNNNTQTMTEKIREVCIDAASRSQIKIVLPLGEAWNEVRSKGFCRLTGDDGCHASRCGEFLSAAVWYEILTGNDITKSTYRLPFVESNITVALKKNAHEIAGKYSLNK